jgi:hypothetical protein
LDAATIGERDTMSTCPKERGRQHGAEAISVTARIAPLHTPVVMARVVTESTRANERPIDGPLAIAGAPGWLQNASY